jgi:hypothetical protein
MPSLAQIPTGILIAPRVATEYGGSSRHDRIVRYESAAIEYMARARILFGDDPTVFRAAVAAYIENSAKGKDPGFRKTIQRIAFGLAFENYRAVLRARGRVPDPRVMLIRHIPGSLTVVKAGVEATVRS